MKKNNLFLIFTLIVFGLVLNPIYSDDDEHEEYEGKSFRVSKFKKSIPIPTNETWKTECSSCHMLYPPQLMKSASWEKMMKGLNQHFGVNAELEDAEYKEIVKFLMDNSADKLNYKRGLKMSDSNSNQIPISISESDYFKRKHHEINPSTYLRKSIRTRANCLACHPGAERGYFEEDEIKIPKDQVLLKPIIKK